MTSVELQAVLDSTWTIKDMVRITGRTRVTLDVYRKEKGLPVVTVRGDGRAGTILFIPEEVRTWAQINCIALDEWVL